VPIVHQSKNFQVEPFADAKGTYFIIKRKSNSKVVAKIPFENQRQVKLDVNNRLKELEMANQITQGKIKKAKKVSKDVFSFLYKSAKSANKFRKKLNKPTRKKRRK